MASHPLARQHSIGVEEQTKSSAEGPARISRSFTWGLASPWNPSLEPQEPRPCESTLEKPDQLLLLSCNAAEPHAWSLCTSGIRNR